MIASAPLYEWLHWWEGREGSPALEAYQDGGGVWTIGYGRTENVKEFDHCTPDQAERWLHDTVSAASPLHRSATPDDCAEAVLAVLRNRYVTGHIFVVDGGISVVS